MGSEKLEKFFKRYEGNPILIPENWPYDVNSVFNPGAVNFDGEVLLLARVEDGQGYSHLTVATSEDGKTQWEISSTPALTAESGFGEAIFGLEDPRIVWQEDRQEYVVTYVSFFKGVAGMPPCISLATTKDFKTFKHLGQQLMPSNKDASLFPRKIRGRYALINRPIVGGTEDIWVSFSKDLKFWGENRVLLSVRSPRTWDCSKIGLGPPPIETPNGWLIIYHGVRNTASGNIYRIGLALLDIETLEVIRRSRDWVFGPKEDYEILGDVGNIVFPCGAVVNGKNELLVYYGAADSVIALTIADLADILQYLEKCKEY